MPEPKKKSELAIARKGKVGKISIEGAIGWDYFGMSYRGFKQALAGLGKVDIIEIEINSPGGVITEGMAMINALREHGATIHTYNVGQAASMGSVLLLSGDRIFIPDNAMTFIHKPLNIVLGNADDMRKMAGELDKFEDALVNVYSTNFKGERDEINELMATETWYSADEMSEKFNNVTVVVSGEQKAAAHEDPFEAFGDLVQFEETILDRGVNALRNRVAGTTKEVDMPMTPEEKQEIVESTTASVIEALDKRDEAKAQAQADADAKAEAEANAEPEDKTEIEFEGDMANPEDVQAHADKVALAELEASADMTTTAGVVAYQAALKKHLGKEEAPAKPGTNASAPEGVLGAGGSDEHSKDDIEAAITSMTSK